MTINALIKSEGGKIFHFCRYTPILSGGDIFVRGFLVMQTPGPGVQIVETEAFEWTDCIPGKYLLQDAEIVLNPDYEGFDEN